MKVLDNWGVLISQTGSEVIAISEKLGILPSLIVTNNITKISPRNMEIFGENNVEIRTLPRKPCIVDYLRTRINLKELITLHGYLRILPAELFPYLEGAVYNGHPALITMYPDLKGFNKQEDIAGNQEKYPFCGSVIHECIPELDAGKVIVSCNIKNTTNTIDEAYELLRNTSLITWEAFFKSWLSEDKSLFLTK
jgi:folate-dependent phosphoribosylglycinamide formyltransferase PurN